MDKRLWVVYLIRCSDESLYCGITNDLKNRLIAHNSGRGAKYTRSRRPFELVGASSAMTKSDALKLEYRVKHVPAGSKYINLLRIRLIWNLIDGEGKKAESLLTTSSNIWISQYINILRYIKSWHILDITRYALKTGIEDIRIFYGL